MISQPNFSLSPTERLSTMYDLPSEDPKELGLPDEFHSYVSNQPTSKPYV
ncbi:MAG: hypothetical protein AB4058_17155 [Microcystaceae cyanobacterium]